MSTDPRSPYRPFSESPVDVPADGEGERMPVAERPRFQEPPAADPQSAAALPGQRPLFAGGMTFSSPERQG